MTQTHKALAWLLVAMLAALLTYVSFRGYLSTELLLQFANTFHC